MQPNTPLEILYRKAAAHGPVLQPELRPEHTEDFRDQLLPLTVDAGDEAYTKTPPSHWPATLIWPSK